MLIYLCLIVKPNSKLLTYNLIDLCKNFIVSYNNVILEENWLEIYESYEILFKANELDKTKLLLQSKKLNCFKLSTCINLKAIFQFVTIKVNFQR